MMLFITILIALLFDYGSSFEVKIQCDAPIVQGATLNCTTWVYDSDQKLASGKYRYSWRDDAIPEHTKLTESGPSIDTWQIPYNRANYTPGVYVIRVDVCQIIFSLFCSNTISAGTIFSITDSLNGQILLNQENISRESIVSTNGTLTNSVALKASDKNYIAKAPTVLSYWFVDCVYYGMNTDLKFNYNFTTPDEQHVIETLVVADFTPLPPPPTTTPSTTTTSSTTPTPTTKSTTTTLKTPTTSVASRPKRDILNTANTPKQDMVLKNASPLATQSNIKVWQNGTLLPYNGSFPYVCNSTIITTDSQNVYGYFQKVVTTKAPVSDVTVSGNNWLQHGELLSLNVNCKGSDKLQFCYYFKKGLYNVTGNEECEEYNDLEKCDFPIQRYFQDQHTVIIIIKNDVNKKISSVAVTVYKVKHQAQLSIIVVPVIFTLVAIVSIIFGVAYYLQNRSRFIVEVADFDFGQKYADMEYKTFKERLRDSVTNAFTRDPASTSSDAPIWPPGHKYGSMT